MKNPKTIFLLTLILTVTTPGLRAEPYRTDINPALLYYQAFIVGAELPQSDHDYLFTNQWQGQTLPARFGELIGQSDNQFNWCAGRRTPRCLAIGALIGPPGQKPCFRI